MTWVPNETPTTVLDFCDLIAGAAHRLAAELAGMELAAPPEWLANKLWGTQRDLRRIERRLRRTAERRIVIDAATLVAIVGADDVLQTQQERVELALDSGALSIDAGKLRSVADTLGVQLNEQEQNND